MDHKSSGEEVSSPGFGWEEAELVRNIEGREKKRERDLGFGRS